MNWRKLTALFTRPRREAELDEELAFHLGEEAADQQAAGLSSREAQDAARRSLGNVTLVKEETRAAWGWTLLETTLQDLRIAARGLRQNPGFGVAAILILGLGIGASTAVFSVVNGVILKPLALRDPDRIVALSSFWKTNGRLGAVSIPDFQDWQTQSSSFEAMSFYTSGNNAAVVLDSGGQFANVARVSKDYFRVMGAEAAVGRLFAQEETTPGGPGAAIVSDSFSRSRFGSESAAMGKTVRVAGMSVPIVGVMPPGFQFPGSTEIWCPVETVAPDPNPNRGGHNFSAVARLKNGTELAAAQAELTVIGNRLEALYKGTNQDKNVSVMPLADALVQDLPTMLYLLLGAVSLLLLIACVNVANLLLAKATTRTRELGVRTALGAGRGRILRQLATESLLLGVASGFTALTIAHYGTQALIALAPADIPRLRETGFDGIVFAFAAGLTLVACLLFGFVPALRATRLDVNRALKQGGSRGLIGSGSGLRRALVIGEVALSVILVTGAGLLIRSFSELSGVELGYETRQVLVMETSNPVTGEEAAARVVRMYESLLEDAATIPGIASIAAVRIPPGRVVSMGSYEVDAAMARGLSTKSDQAAYSIVSPGAFAVLGIPLKQGRDFSSADSTGAPLTVIVNESLARRAFPGQDPIGHSLINGMDTDQPMTIVGVVADTRQYGPIQEGIPEIYMPYRQHPRPSTALRILARTSVPIETVTGALRERARRIAPNMPVRFTTMDERMAEVIARPRFRTLLLAVFAGVALLLCVGGVYSVVSFLVSQRTQEIGLRMAMGADAGRVMKMILSEGGRMALIGLALGFAGAAASAQFLRSMLFAVKPFDPPTYAAVMALIAIVTIGACLLPAYRAAKIDPMRALRQD